jgi:hypothetical protein
MTITDEQTVVLEDEAPAGETAEQKHKRERDFTKFTPKHQELADYINAHSGLNPVSPNQIKAVLVLRSDFTNTPEQIAKREQRKVELAAEKAKFAGMTDAQIKAEKAARRAEAQAQKFEARVAEARAKAEQLRSATAASGEDLAAAVESAQNGEESKRPRLSRNR